MDIIFQCKRILISCLENLDSDSSTSTLIPKLQTVLSLLQNSGQNFSRAIDEIQIAIEILNQDGATSKVGRPPLCLPYENLSFLLGMGLPVCKIAKMCNINRRTVFRKMRMYGLSVRKTFTDLDNEGVDQVLSTILREHPNTGYKRMKGFLKSQKIKIATQRVREGMRRVDPEGVALRKSQNRAIYRRKYYVEHSMDLWHIDTHHKLIKYGFVVRGGIDGKSRTIVYLDIGCDNTSISHFRSFLEGVKAFGIPNRTRSDKGGENVGIAEFMIKCRGVNRGSHICGRSVHNQRIERLWRDVHYGCLTRYRQKFLWLEAEGYLELDNYKKVAVLQYVFLPRLKKHLLEFADGWNHHSISSENNQTPFQMMFFNLPPPEQDMPFTEALISDGLSFMDSNQLETENMVTVEPYEEFLSDDDKLFLSQFDVMRQSQHLGADIYIEIINAMVEHQMI